MITYAIEPITVIAARLKLSRRQAIRFLRALERKTKLVIIVPTGRKLWVNDDVLQMIFQSKPSDLEDRIARLERAVKRLTRPEQTTTEQVAV